MYRLGNNFDRVDSAPLGSSVTGCAVVVAVVPKALLLRNAPNRLGRLVVTAATVGASVESDTIGVIVFTEFTVQNIQISNLWQELSSLWWRPW